jgi:DNA topoisomerase-1
MKKKLVIVESPAKTKTLGKILGKNYSIKASLGHIRDLPKSRLGVDIENGFTPKYVVPRVKRKAMLELKKAAESASSVYLATDPDREGEAISWHISEITRTNNVTHQRVVFYEITKEAILHAFKHPRSIDMQLVNAQQARRILDRLVGYKISPLLWRKVRKGLSAGRVQSVALKLIVDREREIQHFVSLEFWSIEAELSKKTDTHEINPFRATLVGFVDSTNLDMRNVEEATDISYKLEQATYTVTKVATKKVNRRPPPPFITSTLQQEAWRKLHFTARQTMANAQQLYEGLSIGNEGSVGLITYMRTDSTRVAHSAIVEAREYITSKYGAQFTPPYARSFSTRVKGAQEAHEAIRPTRILREPLVIKPYLTPSQFKLYQLIWQRMLASQMSSALSDSTIAEIKARCHDSKLDYLFRASSSTIKFPGFTVLYIEGKDDVESTEKGSPRLPQLAKGDKLQLLGLYPNQHFTQPPPRFNEATLIKMLEQNGIGRPSTYAPILSTIQERDYATKPKGSFRPTELGNVVSDLLSQYFPDIVNAEFTAHMEKELDKVANESRDWVSVVQNFYTPFEKKLEDASLLIDKVKLADEQTDESCPKCSRPIVIKTGRFGKFLACSGYPECKYTKSFQIKIGVNCPQCGNELVERLSKKRTFYGCSNYPNCQFATNARPLPQPCPDCGELLSLYRTKWAKCTKCKYKAELGELEQKAIAS